MKRYMRNDEGFRQPKYFDLADPAGCSGDFCRYRSLVFYYGIPFPAVSVFMLMIMVISFPFCLAFWFIGKKASVFRI